MKAKWSAAPFWLKALCILGIPWCVALVAIGIPFLIKEGPGLPLIWLGMAGLVPWLVVAVRSEST